MFFAYRGFHDHAGAVRPLHSPAEVMSVRKQGGFTLVELMVVVTIIGLSVVAFSPGITRAIAEREVSTATREVLRIAKRGRTEALGFRRAYLMWVRPGTADSVAPIVQLLRAETPSCVTQAWDTLQATCGTPGSACVENRDFNLDANFATRGFTVRMVEEDLAGNPSSNNRAICWAPDGVVYTATMSTLSTGLTIGAAQNTVNGAVVYRFRLFQDGEAIGPPHRLMLPLGGAPMVLP